MSARDPDKAIVSLDFGTNHLINSLYDRYPDLDNAEIEILGNALLNRIGNSIRDGDALGSVRSTPDGKLELRVWEISKIKER